MSRHNCPRCGLESKRDAWWERHPFLAVLFALPAGYTIVGVILAYPWFFVPLLVVVCALLVNRASRRRAAIAARADFEHRQIMVAAMRRLPAVPLPAALPTNFGRPAAPLRAVRPRQPAPWHVVTQLPTRPIRNR
jgi:hypothetical protein